MAIAPARHRAHHIRGEDLATLERRFIAYAILSTTDYGTGWSVNTATGALVAPTTQGNNLVTWLLRNNILVTKATADFSWSGKTYQAWVIPPGAAARWRV